MLTGLNSTEILFVVLSLVVSVTIHEAMHAYAAHVLGDRTAQDMGRLTLNPLKNIDLLTTVLLPLVLMLFGQPPFFIAKPVPFDPSRVKFGEYGAAIVAMAGPVSNFLLAVAAGLVVRVWGWGMDGNLLTALIIFVEVNVAFFVFNMIPIPPLDGSRLLYAFAPEWLQELMYQIESFGFMAILLFVLVIFQFAGTGIYTLEYKLVQFLIG